MKAQITLAKPAVITPEVPASAILELNQEELYVLYAIANQSCTVARNLSKIDTSLNQTKIDQVLYDMWRKLHDAGLASWNTKF